jgi:uncharacterized protein
VTGGTLDALRRIVAPLDLTSLLWVVAGDHETGLALPTTPITVRGVHVEALSAALGAPRRLSTLRLDLLDEGLSIKVRSEDTARVARRLRRGDGTLIETLHSPLVLTGEEALAELRAIARGFVTEGLVGYYAREADRAERAFREAAEPPPALVLRVFRALLAGLHLMETGEVEPALSALVRERDVPFLANFAARPWSRSFVSDPAFLGFLLAEAGRLRDNFALAAARARLPARPAAETERRLADWADKWKPLGAAEAGA